MAGEWHFAKLGDIIEFQRGFDLPQQKRTIGNYPIVSSSGITDHHSKGMVTSPGVVTGRYGTIGKVFYLDQPFWPLNTTLWVKDFKGNYPKFVYYFLHTLDFNSCADKSSVPGVNRNDLHSISVTIPDIQTQRDIADVLSAIDNKIELNRQTNETLEAMAQALFKSWFVDFEAVKAKAEGRKPEGMDDASSVLFPSAFTESVLGLIPEGWKISPLGDIIELAYGKALKANGRNEGFVPVYGSNGQIGWHDTSLIKGPGIVVGRKGNPGTVIYVHEDFFPIDTTFFVIPSKRVPSMIFLRMLMERLGLPNLSADSAVPGLNRNAAYSVQCILPPLNLIKNFNDLITAFILKKENLKKENKHLTSIRDLLLPRLISGKLRMDEISEIADELAS